MPPRRRSGAATSRGSSARTIDPFPIIVGSFSQFPAASAWVRSRDFDAEGELARTIDLFPAIVGSFSRFRLCVLVDSIARFRFEIQEGRPTIPTGRDAWMRERTPPLYLCPPVWNPIAPIRNLLSLSYGTGIRHARTVGRGLELADHNDLLQRSGRLALAVRLDRPSRLRLRRTSRGPHAGARGWPAFPRGERNSAAVRKAAFVGWVELSSARRNPQVE